jgi:hypothetical protein
VIHSQPSQRYSLTNQIFILGALLIDRADLSSTADVMWLAVLAVALLGATIAF